MDQPGGGGEAGDAEFGSLFPWEEEKISSESLAGKVSVS